MLQQSASQAAAFNFKGLMLARKELNCFLQDCVTATVLCRTVLTSLSLSLPPLPPPPPLSLSLFLSELLQHMGTDQNALVQQASAVPIAGRTGTPHASQHHTHHLHEQAAEA